MVTPSTGDHSEEPCKRSRVSSHPVRTKNEFQTSPPLGSVITEKQIKELGEAVTSAFILWDWKNTASLWPHLRRHVTRLDDGNFTKEREAVHFVHVHRKVGDQFLIVTLTWDRGGPLSSVAWDPGTHQRLFGSTHWKKTRKTEKTLKQMWHYMFTRNHHFEDFTKYIV